MSKTIQEKIAALQKEQEQLKARAQQLQSRFNEKEKKVNDRRKIIAGAIFLKDMETNAGMKKYFLRLLADAPDRDKKIFADLLLLSNSSANEGV